MKCIETEPLKEVIVLPMNSGLQGAYFAVLKELYATNEDNFWLEDIVSIISLDCGITVDTAKDKFKQLVRFNLLKYLHSSLSGHRYLVLVYSKIGDGEPIIIDSWEKFNQLLIGQFGNMVEPDLTKIRRSMNSPGQPRLRDAAKELEAQSELKQLDKAAPIRAGKDDLIKSEFKTLNKMSKKELIEQIELAIKNNSDSTADRR